MPARKSAVMIWRPDARARSALNSVAGVLGKAPRLPIHAWLFMLGCSRLVVHAWVLIFGHARMHEGIALQFQQIRTAQRKQCIPLQNPATYQSGDEEKREERPQAPLG